MISSYPITYAPTRWYLYPDDQSPISQNPIENSQVTPRIISRVDKGIEHKRVQIANGQIARKLPFTDWNKIRIALRAGITDYGQNIGGDDWNSIFPSLFVGLCAGTFNLYHDSGSAFGIRFNYVSRYDANYNYQTVSPTAETVRQLYSTSSGYFDRTTEHAGFVKFALIKSSSITQANYGELPFIYIDIERNGGWLPWLMSKAWKQQSNIPETASLFYSELTHEFPNFNEYTNGYMFSPYSNSLANYDEYYGKMDTLCIAWDLNVAALEILDLAVYKIA